MENKHNNIDLPIKNGKTILTNDYIENLIKMYRDKSKNDNIQSDSLNIYSTESDKLSSVTDDPLDIVEDGYGNEVVDSIMKNDENDDEVYSDILMNKLITDDSNNIEINYENSEDIVTEYDSYDLDDYFNKYDKPEEKDEMEIGLFNLIRGKVYEFYELDKNNIITWKDKKDNSKILHLQTVDEFDKFTEKYGFIFSKIDDVHNDPDTIVAIKWNIVSEDYKGLYIDPGLNSDRYKNAMLDNDLHNSWWISEYNIPQTKYIVFMKTEKQDYGINISKHNFKAKMYDDYDIAKNEIIDYNVEGNNKKICKIYSLEQYDNFTKEFGYIKKNTLNIEWNNVLEKWKGIVINDDDFEQLSYRYHVNFYDDKKYKSWWKYYDIALNKIYIIN